MLINYLIQKLNEQDHNALNDSIVTSDVFHLFQEELNNNIE